MASDSLYSPGEAQASPGETPIAISCRGLTKQYGTTTVVDQVDLDIAAGSIHALVGANGAGKSTVLGMLSGRTSVTSGVVELFGEILRPGSPRASRANGIATVYQELTVIPQLTATANVFLGEERHRAGWLSEREMAVRFRGLCADFEVDIPPRILASSLSVAARQLLEIMRAINSEARVVLLDEPTAALSHAERDALLAIIRRLAARGVTIVLVSHNLAEVLDVCDTTSVLRGGRLIETRASSEWTRQELIHSMTGETSEGIMRDERPEYGDVIIEANGVTVPGVIEDIDIVVRAGEVVGLAGLVGSGRTTLLRSLAGAEPRSRGRMRIDGQERKWPHRVRAAVHSLGVALVPEERKTEGLILQQSVPDNVTITRLGDFLMGPFVRTSRQRSRAIALLDQLQLSRPVGSYPVGDLSGGNQQKVAIAKWLHRTPRVLLFDEPTRGIDVAAKAQVLTAIRRYARDGHAVVVTSSELDEVLDVADRLLVMSRGRVVGNIDLHERVPSAREILELSFERTG